MQSVLHTLSDSRTIIAGVHRSTHTIDSVGLLALSCETLANVTYGASFTAWVCKAATPRSHARTRSASAAKAARLATLPKENTACCVGNSWDL